MNMVGNSSNRIHRQGNSIPASETRWIVPVRPYTPPKGSAEQVENIILTCIGVVAVVFGFTVIIMSAM